MSRPQRDEERRADPDGIVHVRGGSVSPGAIWVVAVFVIMVGAVVALMAFELGDASAPEARMLEPAEPRQLTERTREPAPSPEVVPAKRVATAPEVAPAAHLVEEPSPPTDEEPEMPVDDSGGPSGLAVFPPPGTKPIKIGIVVPEDFDLPPGYMRHHQTTDDGQMLPGILVFHPDHQPVDADGNPIDVGEDRVVPPELAPPGMPIQMLELPREEE